MAIPKDPIMLLSYINTQLRDFYKDIATLCDDKNINEAELCETLAKIDYYYDKDHNQFK